MTSNLSPTIKLNNGQAIPQLGLGVYKLATDVAEGLIHKAIEAGYRRIDTASFYGNEKEIGDGVRTSGLPREEIYVTTKIWNDDQGHDRTLEAIDESLNRLNIDYIDMLLIHWPKPAQDLYLETWEAFEKAVTAGKIRGIGVSNFQTTHLERLIAAGGTVPALNQVELHPGLQQKQLREFNAAHGVATEAWSPLARGRFDENAEVVAIANKHGKSPAQIIIRWHLELGNLVIPKTATESRLKENISVFDFSLDAEDMTKIASLDSGLRTGPDPDEF